MDKTRCHWFDESNEIISKYHDEEFGILNIDDDYLFEILVLVNFQTGLSWEIMLKKREDFRIAFDGFDVEKIAGYDEKRIEELLKNENIIRNKNKIKAVINNAKVFIKIQEDYGSFYDYIKTFPWPNHYVFLSSDNRCHKLPRRELLFVLIFIFFKINLKSF